MSEAQQGGSAGVDSRRLANEALRCIRLLRKEIKENVVPTPYEVRYGPCFYQQVLCDR